jgi:hypothetical protein
MVMVIEPAGKVVVTRPAKVGFLTPVNVNVIGVFALIWVVAVDVITLAPIVTVDTAVVLLDVAIAGGELEAIPANWGGKLIVILEPAGIVYEGTHVKVYSTSTSS